MKKYKKPFFFVVLPLLIVLYFTCFQKYTHEFESHPVYPSTFTEILTKYDVSYVLAKDEKCIFDKKDKESFENASCTFTYNASLPKFFYYKFYYYTVN